MSQYPPPYGYGQYHGQHPPQPCGYQNAPNYPAPSYNAPPYNASAPDIYRDASQASFDYNASHIPGLGIGAPVSGGGQYGLDAGPIPWTQPHLFPASTSQVPSPHAFASGALNPQFSPSDRTTSGPRGGTKTPHKPVPPPSRQAANTDIEEGELSEGQFEDLYEPREPVVDVAKLVPKPLPTGNQSQPTSAADTPDGGFYGSDEDEGEGASRGNEGRERSASYSPFLSPREIQREIPTPQPTAGKGDGTSISLLLTTLLTSFADPKVQPASVPAATDAPNAVVPGLQLTDGPLAKSPTSKDLRRQGAPTPESSRDLLGSVKSVQEAKKEARKAILRLWSLGVKYQNYIDEGFDEKLIKGLFQDLHLDMPKATTKSPAPEAAQPRQGADSVSAKPALLDAQQEQSAPTSKDPSVQGQKGKGEERKDRIARLLAAKAAKAPATAKPVPALTEDKPKTMETQSQTSAPSPPGVSKTKMWGEKERLLQQKIAALQKSREAQAQKSATDKVDQGVSKPGHNQADGTTHSGRAGDPGSLPIPTVPTATLPRTPSTQPNQAQQSPAIPGLLLSPNAQLNPSGQRKRPVASDFVDYSSGPSGHIKRPFSQARKETSLIIDVSDASSDEEMDMDVEMDMGSPVEPSSIQSGGIPTQSGPSIRDFPPLTDNFPQRQFSSPAPSLTPPGSLPNGKKRVTELDLKEKEIQEMRRKIALAEARRKAKQSSGGSLTPNHSGRTPEPKEGEAFRLPPTERVVSMSTSDQPEEASPQLTPEVPSVTLPKSSDALRLDPSKRAERRGRIMSLDLPRVDSSLEEKLKRLKQLRDEEAQLQAEIDRSLVEKKLLTDELEQLDTTPADESPQPNGLGSGNSSGHSPPSIPSTSEASQEIGDVSMDEVGSSGGQSQGLSHPNGSNEPETGVPSSVASPSDIQNNINNESVEMLSEAAASTRQQSLEQLPAKDNAGVELGTVDVSAATPQPRDPTSDDSATSEARGQLDMARADETTPMELESRSPSPEVAGPPLHRVDAGGDVNNARQSSPPLPDQISSVAQPREELQEIENETTGEVNVVSPVHDKPASKANSTLMPYKSPLRYFNAYRFHAEYRDSVAGGLKSLTYSNRIDPQKEFCPSELNGEQCAANCQFQHFGAISAPAIYHPDDQILLELGNPDDYSGEEKTRFIQGLRELLQRFKADKVKDFDTIARGIIDFRSEILKDKSKVLRLEGVTI
ncbi:Protein red1 [Madurella mycetomatis]|uniref:Protein red1 n=1 Tax=Madurella mycetomatis TaxID=100816 RepID=A0A175W910_9PEZI|nr:Protein red1 [Madurella mycetomatis]